MKAYKVQKCTAYSATAHCVSTKDRDCKLADFYVHLALGGCEGRGPDTSPPDTSPPGHEPAGHEPAGQKPARWGVTSPPEVSQNPAT